MILPFRSVRSAYLISRFLDDYSSDFFLNLSLSSYNCLVHTQGFKVGYFIGSNKYKGTKKN